jgi:riboflavin synthase
MFTGIIQAAGLFRGFRDGGREMLIDAPSVAEKLAIGGSLAVDGVCLTLVRKERGRLVFNPARETLARTEFRNRRVGDPLNLECPLTLSDPLGGHMVTGHVDFSARVKRLASRPPGRRLVVALPREFRPFLVAQGSVAVNGVSLTVAAVGPDTFEAELIPATIEATNLSRLRAGSTVHVECDLIGKYVYNFFKSRKP